MPRVYPFLRSKNKIKTFIYPSPDNVVNPLQCKAQYDGHSQGNISLYLLFFLPLSLMITFIGLDISAWNSLRIKLQNEADNIALRAAHSLPDKERIRSLINYELQELDVKNIVSELSFPENSNSSIKLKLSANYQSNFFSFLGLINNDSFLVEKQSIVQLVPTDYVFILVDGNSLRPKLLKDNNSNYQLEAPWGEEEYWPASRYFICNNKPKITKLSDFPWWNLWEENNFQRWLTQSCFNPVFSSLKSTAIALIDDYSQFRGNRIALIFTPGEISHRGYFVSRHLRGEQENKNYFSGQKGGFFSTELSISQASWSDNYELDNLLGNEKCSLFSNTLDDEQNHYALLVNNSFNKPGDCQNPFNSPVCDRPYSVTSQISPCYLEESLLLREAVYWQGAKLAANSFAASPRLIPALEQAIIEFDFIGDASTLKSELSVRGNFAYANLRKLIVFTDNLSEIDSNLEVFQQRMKRLINLGVEVNFIVFSHRGLSEKEKENLVLNYNNLKNLFQTDIKTFFTNEAEELKKFIGPLINRSRVFSIKQ